MAEERALIVTRRDSVPVRKSTVVIVPIAVYEREATKASSVESASTKAAAVEAAPAGVAAVEAATTSAMDSAALETAALGRRRVCTECSEGARASNVAIVFGIISKSSENARTARRCAVLELNELLLDGKEHPKGADFVNGRPNEESVGLCR